MTNDLPPASEWEAVTMAYSDMKQDQLDNREIVRARVRIANLEIECEELTERVHTLEHRLKSIANLAVESANG